MLFYVMHLNLIFLLIFNIFMFDEFMLQYMLIYLLKFL